MSTQVQLIHQIKTVKNIKYSVENAVHCSLSSDHSSTNCFYTALNKKKKCFARKERVDLFWSYGNKG